jgi:hypothetical protein
VSGPRGLVRSLRTTVRDTLGARTPSGPTGAGEDDPFAAFRSLTGPTLVSNPTPRHDPALDGDPCLVVLLPHLDLDRMSGGPNTVFQVTARLVREGLRLRYVATSGPLRPDVPALLDHIGRVSGVTAPDGAIDLVDASMRKATFALGRDDVLLASWWPTAHLAQAALDHVRADAFLYLVQDYEPGFYPWSSKAALAEATYAMPMRPIVNEPFLDTFLHDRGAGHFADPAWPRTMFMPAVDRAVFRPRRVDRPAGSPRRLVFYARPRNPRNLFEIGLRALRSAAAAGVFDDGPWEFAAVGQDLPDLPLTERYTLRAQPWLSYEAYGELLGSADVLLSLMLSPHTSYPPLEMAAAGGQVVTNTYGPKTADALAAISPSLHAVPPDVDSLVGALRDAVGAVGTSTAAIGLPATWDEALADVVPWVARQVRDLRAGP